MGYAEIIAGGIAKPEDVAPFAGKIRTEAQRLLALIEDIIHLSRLDEGGETVAFEPVELSALCDTVRDRLQSKGSRQGHRAAHRGRTGCGFRSAPHARADDLQSDG